MNDPNAIRALSMFSSGAMSWAATKRHAERNGIDGLRLLFADTLIEDEDNYRFLIESAANIFGLRGPEIDCLSSDARKIPAVETNRWASRVEALSRIREAVKVLIPSLYWVADGRSPWQVFADERFIGNSRVDPCSKILKRQLMDKWRDKFADRANTVLIFGLDWQERGRIEGKYVKGEWKPGHRERLSSLGWKPSYPMNEQPYYTHDQILEWIRSEGIEPPRLYDMGFPHANCGGYCCKMGLAQAKHLLGVMPDRFAWHEKQEKAALEIIGSSAVPALRLRSKGRSRRLTLEEFHQIQEQ